ncbi:MAG TPA: A/G-specific adenine glycosylase [Methylotenera sp.]|nr:A/G-specific adenine glycosylase [Methylotenera sp.]
MDKFSDAIIAWQKLYGRHDLPWQTKLNEAPDPYAIWVSEIMLQQTQVAAVMGYYAKFIKRFPTIELLAAATQDEVLQHWSGLGYYSRARNLHSAAQIITDDFNGKFPQNFEDILSLPGIGHSTAAAISTFAFNQPMPILDGNVKRVFARHFNIAGWSGLPKIQQSMWQIAIRENPQEDAIAYTQGLMDLGATLCTRSKPKCPVCPVNTSCAALANHNVSQLPTPKPRKAIPERNIYFLVYQNINDILLERRANKGIWGGLWSFPEAEALPTKGQENMQLLPQFSHTFTHFRLHIQPVLIQSAVQTILPNSLWTGLEEAMEAAIPTPVRKILVTLSNQK